MKTKWLSLLACLPLLLPPGVCVCCAAERPDAAAPACACGCCHDEPADRGPAPADHTPACPVASAPERHPPPESSVAQMTAPDGPATTSFAADPAPRIDCRAPADPRPTTPLYLAHCSLLI